MPRLTRAVPAYRHHKASGQAVVSLNHKLIYLGKWNSASSKEAYDRLIAEYLASKRQKVASVTGTPLTVSDLILNYWKHVEGYYVKNGRPTDEQGAIKLALRALRKLYGRSPAMDFGPVKLDAVRQRMITRKLARKTRGRHVRNDNVPHELVRPKAPMQARFDVRSVTRPRLYNEQVAVPPLRHLTTRLKQPTYPAGN